MYKYETHCHSSIISICSKMTPKDLVDFYLVNGYKGIFITEHFLNNGSCNVLRTHPDAPYPEKMHAFTESYRQLKEVAKGTSLDIFFGFEYSYKGTDVLIYGWDEEDLIRYDHILNLTMREFIAFAKEHGALAIQAHPFREAYYIDHIRLFPEVEGVEVFNGNNAERSNTIGKYYAELYEKLETGGTDLHRFTTGIISGMAFETPLTSVEDYIARVRNHEGEVIHQQSLWKNP